MIIRKATNKDVKEIAKLMLREFRKPPFNEKVSINAVLKSLKFYFKIGKVYVAVNKDEIVGVTVFKIEQYWGGPVIIIEDLAVKEEFKKQKIEKKIIQQIEDYAKINKISSISFSTHKKSPTVKLYNKYGYKTEKDTLFMKKKLK